ncbi:MAG TPA: hypothetical protein VN253_28465 [Kofleriaceae bacterium]|nr:hypothetical protein [Kofleriaceae bacterium]
MATLEVGTLRRRLLAGVALVSALGAAAELWHACSSDAVIEALLPKLSLSYETNVPTWFSSSLLLLCALAAGSIASAIPRGARWRVHWWGIAIGLGYVSLDEAAELHEHLSGHFDTGGVLYFDWVIPAVAIVALLAALYLPFVRALPSRTRVRLIIAGVIYIGGALVMELPLGWWTEHVGADNLGYALIDWFEETLEMIGASLALVALVAHSREVS